MNPNRGIGGSLWGSLPRELMTKILLLIPGCLNKKQREQLREEGEVSLTEIQEYCRKVEKPVFFTSAGNDQELKKCF